MDARTTVPEPLPFSAPLSSVLSLKPDVSARLLAAAGDVALVLDRKGVIRDVAAGNPEIAAQGVGAWLDRPWVDTVTVDGKPKVEEMLTGASEARWRQVNHDLPAGELAIRWYVVDAGHDGSKIAIGRDLRAMAALQQRLLQAQQSMERDFVRLRQAETRYRLLFDMAAEAVLVVDAGTRRIVEANAAAEALAGRPLKGQSIVSLVDSASRDVVLGHLGAVTAAESVGSVAVRVGDREASMAASFFRQGRTALFLIRIGSDAAPATALGDLLERIPDAFVLTDQDLRIVAQNDAFLGLTEYARGSEVVGQPLARFVGRPGIDGELIQNQLREHGVLRNFATIVRGRFDAQDDVEVSAVAAPDGGATAYGFTIRTVARGRDAPIAGIDAPRSVEQLTELVGRVSLKDIVRESTDLIERLCIEAALAHTSDNRASAAEILGLSRQSLYSKLHRFGLVSAGADEE